MRRLLVGVVGSALFLMGVLPAMAATPDRTGQARRGPAGALACGESWGVDSSPSPLGGSQLYGVAASSSTDAWAVGSVFGGPLLAEHWDGTTWTVVPTPNPAPPGNQNLAAVAAISPTDAWAVGYYNDPGTLPLALRWDGTSWTQSFMPVQPGHAYQLFGVTAISSDDVWAVGIDGTDHQATLAFHWDGTSWSQIPTVDPDEQQVFSAVGAISANDVWAVGNHFDTVTYAQKTLTEHWDGTSWSVVPSPNGGGNTTVLQGVSGAASNDVWAVGETENPFQATTLALRWDGTSWTIVPTPNPGDGRNQLFAVAAAATDNVFAVGDWVGSGVPEQGALLERWDGTTWTTIANPQPSTDVNFFYSVAALPSGAAWAVGNTFNTSTFQEDTLIESTSACSADVGVSVSDSPDPVIVGSTLTYRVTVTNAGPDSATNVTLTGVPPAASTLLRLFVSQGTCSKASRNCRLGTIQAGASAQVLVQVRPQQPGAISLSATATADQTDPGPGNNSDTEVTTVVPGLAGARS